MRLTASKHHVGNLSEGKDSSIISFGGNAAVPGVISGKNSCFSVSPPKLPLGKDVAKTQGNK
jgi:hypothetical protein